MTSVQFSRLELLYGSLKGTVHIQFRFMGSDTVWDEYFVPTTLHGYPCEGNNPQETVENIARARSRADAFIAAVRPFAEVWEVLL